MLSDKDRIFTNLYGQRDWRLAGARARGDWDNIAGLLSPGRDAVVETVKLSGLRGRGGAGFPTGVKWKFAADAPGEQKYIICNGDEGDPGAFMDRG
ncbi:MAG TPA: NADH-quinone oxidoreductase subunit F, partial [Acetobacteraceae bacterium]|nr:NADH-quinone oxidoreductase subunit F [Acetobacteraceae bacterium]